MANRYANLVGTKKISEDFNNINIGFDRVQADMDANKGVAEAHINNTGIHVTPAKKAEWDAKAPGSTLDELHDHMADQVVHVTQADHDKLDGIEDGAEVNQPAFAKVNDIEAADPSDAVTIKGGIGITVTTNPNSNEVEITATGDAAPGAHGPTHTEYGADPIPAATVDEGGIMSAEQVADLITHGELLEEQAQAITNLEDRLDTADTIDLTLQPGLQVVNAAKDARFNLVRIAGKTEINYDGRIGLIGVENPYVTRYGENLLPPFYDWTNANGGGLTINSPYDATLVRNASGQSLRVEVPVIPGQIYTLSLASPNPAYVSLHFYDSSGALVSSPVDGLENTPVSATAPNNSAYVRVVLGGDIGTYNFRNPMLTLGSEPKPFKPREDSMLAFQTELHANPDDGSDPDVLFEREGQYFRLAKWKKVVLDGSLPWYTIHAAGTGYKNPIVPSTGLPKIKTTNQGYVTDYKGFNLPPMTPSAEGGFYADANNIVISVSNADSGWGDAYTPSPDEIKAYFMGWRMFADGDRSKLYNGSGTRWWYKINNRPDVSTNVLPTSSYPEWTPYQLLYRLATPTVEPVVFEGCLTLIEGDNQVEAGTGIVLRENAKPYRDPTTLDISINALPASYLNYKADKILNLYADNGPITNWTEISKTHPSSANGAWINLIGGPRGETYDPSAAYSVTYLKLDKSPIQPISGTLAANEKTQISDLTAGVAEAMRRVSIVEMKKAEKDSPGWITPTLLNGWVPFASNYYDPQYYKDSSGYVHIRGFVKSGSTATTLFVLPVGYRPKRWISLSTLTKSSSSLIITAIEIRADGNVYLSSNAGTDWVQLDGISFLAEQ